MLSSNNLHVIKWYVDSTFAVHTDFKSHFGAIMTYGGGMAKSISDKQKLNTQSSTEAELVGADYVAVIILWTKLFIEAQGHKVENNILYQDNKSNILLGKNGRRSSSKCTRVFTIHYFFLMDQIEKGNLCLEYCLATEMIGDYVFKPKQGKLFQNFKRDIMGHKIVLPKKW
jgi:hypothetical protein